MKYIIIPTLRFIGFLLYAAFIACMIPFYLVFSIWHWDIKWDKSFYDTVTFKNDDGCFMKVERWLEPDYKYMTFKDYVLDRRVYEKRSSKLTVKLNQDDFRPYWIRIDEKNMPAENETVWLMDEKTKFVMLGCRVWTGDCWLWAKSNGIIYTENGKIVSECESDDDYEITHFSKLPLVI